MEWGNKITLNESMHVTTNIYNFPRVVSPEGIYVSFVVVSVTRNLGESGSYGDIHRRTDRWTFGY
jgi:hypothetical protein